MNTRRIYTQNLHPYGNFQPQVITLFCYSTVSFIHHFFVSLLIFQVRLSIKTSTVSTRKKWRSNRRLFSELDDFDQDIIIGNTASDRQENATFNEGTGDQELTIGSPVSVLTANENVVNVKPLERFFIERIDREMGNAVDTVENGIQNPILTATDSIVAPKIELAIRSINACSGQDMTSVTANSERGEHMGITAPFENVFERNLLFSLLFQIARSLPQIVCWYAFFYPL